MTTRTTKRDPGEPTWYDLMTPDMEGAKKFYGQLFGWDFVDTGEEFGHYHMAMVQGRNAAGMGTMPPGVPMPSAWTAYFSTDDIAADVARAKKLGGQVINDVLTIGDSGAMAICADPTGAVFGLWQANKHIGFSVEGEHGSKSWTELHTRNLAAASDFYGKLCNLTAHPMKGMDYTIMQRGERMICGVQQMEANQEGVPPHWMIYFTVDDADAAVEKVTAAGGTVLVPAFDMPYGRMAVFNDPFGATFSVVQPPAA